MQRRILIFHNAFAAKGKSRWGLSKIKVLLHMEGIESFVVESAANVEANSNYLLQAFTKFEPTEIWVNGGDGTLHLFINALPPTMWHLPVAIIPSGTGNDFIKNYAPTATQNNCLQMALWGKPQWVDVWQCNTRLFIHGIGVGFDGKVVESMVKSPSWFSGFFAYYYHVIRHLFTYKEEEFTLLTNGQETIFSCFMITVANSTTFGGGFKVTPQANIKDGLLDVCAISKVGIAQRGRYLKMVEKGKHLHLPVVNYFRATAISLKLPYNMPAHIDGELFYDNSFEITKHTKQLNIIR